MPVYLPGLTLGGRGYGGAAYGYSPYGSGAFPRLPVAVDGGFGGDPFGYESYGSVDIIQPTITGASSIDGFNVEVFFSEEMLENAALLDPANYSFTSTFGVALVPSGVAVGVRGALGGVTSVIVTHSGSTLGGAYLVTAANLEDMAGNPILASSAAFYALGDATAVEVSLPVPDDGRTVVLSFRTSGNVPQSLLTETAFSPGVESLSSYDLVSDYPVTPTLSNPDQDAADLSKVTLDVHPMTSTEYDLTVGPALVFDYDGSVLPDDDPDLTGVEVGTGTSSASLADGLILGKTAGGTYGWNFGDTTGRLVTGSTFRVDFHLDASVAAISPAVFNSTLGTLVVSDGAVELYLTLDDVAGTKTIELTSGVLSASFPAAWDAGPVTISLVRNQRAGFYTVLLNDVPLYTAAIADATAPPTIAEGAAVYLGPAHAVSTFKVRGVEITASSTLFTSSWNFLHNLHLTFTGSSVLTRDRILTKRGPLVRGWGDDTPATVRDVEVRVNSVPVEIARVNPYVGHIFPTIPIPRGTAGTVDVEVDYIWFKNPAFPLAGLNTEGLALNVWSRAVGTHPAGVSPLPATSHGVMARHRFPMGVVLGPLTRPSPLAIGHRYIGYQKSGYSALLNSPSTLLLNQNPHAISVGGVSASSIEESGSFDGATSPQTAETPWELDGVDTGGLVGDGTWRIVDASSGPYGVGTAAFYKRELDLSLAASVNESGRFKVEATDPDGVFTGVGFGLHDGKRLLIVGALLVGDMMHLGVLTDASNPHLEESWQIGPGAAATATSQTEITVPYEEFAAGIESGSRFRVASGNQAGVYTIEECGVSLAEDGATVTVTFTPELPADVGTFGNDTFDILFETAWDEDLVSIRTNGEWPDGTITVTLAGAVSGTIAEVSSLAPYPAQTSLLLPTIKKGVAFWGSLSRRATSTSVWDLVLYASYPERVLQTVQGLTVQTEMNVLPQDDPNDPWAIVGGFGFSEVDATGNQVLLKSTSASSDGAIDEEFSYQRVEPFFSTKVTNDLEAKFRIESGHLGAGDVSVVLNDGVRTATLAPLLYTEGSGLRRLVTDLPQVSLSGLMDPQTEGWTKESGNTVPDPYAQGQTLDFTKSTTQTGSWYKGLSVPTIAKYEGLISEARIAISAATNGTGSLKVGCYHGCRVILASGQSRWVGLTFDTAGNLILFDRTLTAKATVAFAWNDGLPHTYRLFCDPVADSVVLVADDLVLHSEALSSFAIDGSGAAAFIGAEGDGTCSWSVYSASAIPLRPLPQSGQTLGRTFGLLLRGGNPASINGYAIPRTDTSEAANSSLSAVPVLMDWRDWCHIRLLYDPKWGVSFYRPDLPLPPWFTGDFVTRSTDPTASWATVEYANLPAESSPRGWVAFGARDPKGISQSRWDFFRYRIRGNYAGFGIAPQNMVLNRAFTFNSGEWNYDTTPEVRTIVSRSSTVVHLLDSAIAADRVFVVQVGDTVLPSTSYSFDKATQNLTLTSPLPSPQYPVTVAFAAARPVTEEYICSQPFEGSVTVLNEGTPPVPKSRQAETTTQTTAGSRINDPRDVLDSAESLVLNDPYRFVETVDGDNALYSNTRFCKVTDGEPVHISIACDDGGVAEIELEGQWSSEEYSVPHGPAGPWKGQSPVVGGSAAKFSQVSILAASGGRRTTNGVLGGGVASVSGTTTPVLYPNGRGPTWEPLAPGTSFGFNQDFLLVLEDVTPREEIFDVQSVFSDNTPPSSADPTTDPNPDGVPGVFNHGAVAYEMEDSAPSPFSRLGPWGGLSTLTTRSLLAGGGALTSRAFILQGGGPLPVVTTVTTGVLEPTS